MDGQWKRIAALHGLLGTALGVLEGLVMNGELSDDTCSAVSAIVDRLREKADELSNVSHED